MKNRIISVLVAFFAIVGFLSVINKIDALIPELDFCEKYAVEEDDDSKGKKK